MPASQGSVGYGTSQAANVLGFRPIHKVRAAHTPVPEAA